MAILIIALFVFSMIHFVYEGILLPSIRLGLRDRLFDLRDELRAMKIKKPDDFRDDAFEIVHDGINNFLNRLPQLTISFERQFRKACDSDPKFRAEIDKRRATVDASQSVQLKEIVKRADAILQDAFIANAAAWFVYLIPIIAFGLTLSATASQLRAALSVPMAKAAEFLPPIRGGLRPA
jgi:hypothetical protein